MKVIITVFNIFLLSVFIMNCSGNETKKPEIKKEKVIKDDKPNNNKENKNKVDELIQEAKELGDKGEYKQAIKKLNEAKNLGKSSEPGAEENSQNLTPEQQKEINELLKKYKQLQKINDLISEAKNLGRNQKYQDALIQLDTAKSYKNPEPTNIQMEEINRLSNLYKTHLDNQKNQSKPRFKHLNPTYWDNRLKMWRKLE